MQFFQVLFLWNFSRLWKYIVRNSHYSQSYGFFNSHVWMWELDYKEGWALKNWCFWTVMLEKTLESPLDCKENKPVNPEGNQPWIVIEKTDAEAETLATWCKDLTLRKDPDAVNVWRQEEKGLTEDEMVGWHYWLNGHKFEQILGNSEILASCSPCGCKESDTTEQLNNSNNTIGSTYVW